AKRKETIERVFADAKEKHGMRYTLYRGLTQVSKWVRLKFAAMNLKKLARWKAKRLSHLYFLLFSAHMYLLCFAACQDFSLAGRFSTGWFFRPSKRNPSWVPLVTLFLPAADGFPAFLTL
uniref:transposase n=1 Tax=uncultured Oscillibacter sp. TaxID=876091 RepID=UPI00272EC38D